MGRVRYNKIKNKFVMRQKKNGLKSDKSAAMAFEWIYALLFIMALGLLYIVFNQMIVNHIAPLPEEMIPDSFEDKDEIMDNTDVYLTYWNVIPYILPLLIVVYLIVRSIIYNGTGM